MQPSHWIAESPRRRKVYRVHLLCALLLFANACFSDSADQPLADACEEAGLRVEQCVSAAAAGSQLPGDCEFVVEEAASCASDKSDFLGASLCELGLLHYCSTPLCEQTVPELPTDCTQYLGEDGCASCDYYLCKEAADGASACGEDGYYLRYGFKYCERISLVTRPQLSAAGQVWLDEARVCLMRTIEREIDGNESCETLTQIAFDSHPDCYIEAGFCDLPVSDMWAVFTTVDPSDFELQQVLSTGVSCFQDLFE
jgi:hypothetical protein